MPVGLPRCLSLSHSPTPVFPPLPLSVCLSLSVPLSLTCLPHLSSASSVCLPSHTHSSHTPMSVWVYVCVSFCDLLLSPLFAFRGALPFPWHPGFSHPPPCLPTSGKGGVRGQSHCSWGPTDSSDSLDNGTRENPTLSRFPVPKPFVVSMTGKKRWGKGQIAVK